MANLRNKDIFAELKNRVKEAEAIKQIASKEASVQNSIIGKVNKDTKVTSTDEAPINKEEVKPENNTPQGYEQKKSPDGNAPLKSASLKDTADEILKKASGTSGSVQNSIKGKVNKDTEVTSTKDEHNINKEEVKPENNTPQGYEQKPSGDKNAPLKSASEKQAALSATFTKGRKHWANYCKYASINPIVDSDRMKVAGSRDFELLTQFAHTELNEKEAAYQQDVYENEKAGADLFDETILKLAAFEEEQARKEAAAAPTTVAKEASYADQSEIFKKYEEKIAALTEQLAHTTKIAEAAAQLAISKEDEAEALRNKEALFNEFAARFSGPLKDKVIDAIRNEAR